MALEFPWWLRLAHVFNLLFVLLLIRNGIGIVGPIPDSTGTTTRSRAPSG